jgi:predicted Zn-dependent peptidase
MTTLVRNLDAALNLFADVVARPAFRDEDWQRVQQQRLVTLLQSLDQPATIVSREFARAVYGDAHPYGRDPLGTPESVRSITPADLRSYHQRFYTPSNANLIVVGDVNVGELRPGLESALSSWQGGAAPPVVSPSPPAPQTAATIYLIDKPGAAQSEIRIGHEGVNRMSPDYFALTVLNALFGGEFTSRVNMNLREDKGYSYGAYSAFTMARIAGPFVTGGAVQTAVTRESVTELMKELDDIRGPRPASEDEVETTKLALIRREALRLETNAQVAARITDLVRYGLPLDYFNRYTDELAKVTVADVNRVAREQLRPARAAIVIVGDRSVIEQELRTLPYPVQIVSIAGQGTAGPGQQ